MDYSSINNMLNTLEINNQTVSPNPRTDLNSNPNPSSCENPSSSPRTNSNSNSNYVDNKRAMTDSLQRDINLNQKQPNFELVNPQRQKKLDDEYQKFDQSNNMINNYNFAYSQRTINPNQFIDFTKMNTQQAKDKTDINDRLNNRGFTPGTSNKFFN